MKPKNCTIFLITAAIHLQKASTRVVRTLRVPSALVSSAQSSFTQCQMPIMIMSGPFMHATALRERKLPIILFFGISKSHVFCNAVTSPIPHLLLPPLVSLFSINSSQSLYNPCNNPEERARKTFFFLTLIPMDRILL